MAPTHTYIHDCTPRPWQELPPSTYPAKWHRKDRANRGNPCDTALMCARLEKYKRTHGTLKGFDPKDDRFEYPSPEPTYTQTILSLTWGRHTWPHDCTQPLKANRTHLNKHYKYPELYGPPCEPSYIETAWARSGHNNTTLRGRRPPGQTAPRIVYRFLFQDGSVYYGETWKTAEQRLDGHLRQPYPIGRKLRTGMPYQLDTLFQCPSRPAAKRLEKFLINLRKQVRNPKGELLNVAHN